MNNPSVLETSDDGTTPVHGVLGPEDASAFAAYIDRVPSDQRVPCTLNIDWCPGDPIEDVEEIEASDGRGAIHHRSRWNLIKKFSQPSGEHHEQPALALVAYIYDEDMSEDVLLDLSIEQTVPMNRHELARYADELGALAKLLADVARRDPDGLKP
jgi:hypothetical protein